MIPCGGALLVLGCLHLKSSACCAVSHHRASYQVRYWPVGQDTFLLEALFRNEAWGHMLAPISEANERAVYQSMLEGCQAALDGYGLSPCSPRPVLLSVSLETVQGMLGPPSKAYERTVYQCMLQGCQAAADGYSPSLQLLATLIIKYPMIAAF